MPVLEQLEVALWQRTWADQRHLAAQHVHELWKLVEREAPQEASHGRETGVVLDLEERPGGLVELLQRSLVLVRVAVHRAELQARERQLPDAGTHRAVEDRPARGDPHGKRDRGKQGTEQDKQ